MATPEVSEIALGTVSGQQTGIPRTNVLGVGISAINIPLAVATIERWIEERARHYVCVTSVHGVMECQHDPALRRIFNGSGMTTPDGMPLVWLSRFAGQKDVSRVYGPDLMLATCRQSVASGYRHYLFGGVDGVAELLGARLCDRFPGIQIVGTYCPPFRPLEEAEDHEIIARINAAQPDIVWVGMSTPKQDRWMAAHVGKLSAAVIIGVGAAFDFHCGRIKQAPRWMMRFGLEWLFRLTQEPGRLWKRYLAIIVPFIVLVVLQSIGLKRYSLLDAGECSASTV